MGAEAEEMLVKITAAGTISIPKRYRRYMDIRGGDYVRVVLRGDSLEVRKATIT